MTEERFAWQVRQALNQNLDDIPPTALRRMEAARHLALSRQKTPQEAWSLVAADHGAEATADKPQRRALPHFLAALALVIGMVIAAYWQGDNYVRDLEEVDSALLADELPPEAFLDKGFSTWLQDDSSED